MKGIDLNRDTKYITIQKDDDDVIISDDELGIYIQAHSEDRAKKMYEEARKNLRSKKP